MSWMVDGRVGWGRTWAYSYWCSFWPRWSAVSCRAPVLCLALCLGLGACGTLPQPFLGRPGATAERLSQPPPSRLTIPVPSQSMLNDAGAANWASAMAEALIAQDIPAVTGLRARQKEWTLTLDAVLRGQDVVPSYTVRNPAGEIMGVSEAPPIPVANWATSDPGMLQAATKNAALGVVSLLGRIEAAQKQSDPNSLLNRPARVWFTGVTGAPGDGDTSLAAQMRTKLTNLGIVVQDDAKGADFSLAGTVATVPGLAGTIRIEVQWTIADGKGERGRILQLNEVPPATVNRFWGDVAVVVAAEASVGVRDVIVNAGGRKPGGKPGET